MLTFKCFLLFFCWVSKSFGASVLTLSEVIDAAQLNYPLILLAEAEARKAQGELQSAYGGFDPVMKAAHSKSRIGYYSNNYMDFSVEQPTGLWGTRLFGGWRKGDGNFPIYEAKMATFTDGEFRAGLEVPLLKGGPIDERRMTIMTSEQGFKGVQANVSSQRLEVVRQASCKYWDWVFTGQKIIIMKELLEIAVLRSDAIQKKVWHGDTPEFDQTDNERSVLQRQSNVIAAERAFQKASFELSLYYRNSAGEPRIPSIDFLPRVFSSSELSQLIEKAEKSNNFLSNHPEVRKIAFQLQQVDTQARFAQNQLLPRFDFHIGIYSDFGVNAGNSYLPPTQYPSELRMGLVLEFPLFFRGARGQVKASLAAIDRVLASQQFILNRLEMQLKDSVLAMKAAYSRLLLVKDEVKLSKKLEAAERIRAEHGDSSILIVNLREQTTRDAMVKEIEAFADFHKAKADYEAAQGLSHIDR